MLEVHLKNLGIEATGVQVDKSTRVVKVETQYGNTYVITFDYLADLSQQHQQ